MDPVTMQEVYKVIDRRIGTLDAMLEDARRSDVYTTEGVIKNSRAELVSLKTELGTLEADYIETMAKHYEERKKESFVNKYFPETNDDREKE